MRPNNLFLGILVILIAATFVLPGCSQPASSTETSTNAQQPETQAIETPSGFLTYENSAAGIRITHPAEWNTRENVMGMTVAFLSPKENPQDDFQENLNVYIEDISAQPMTLDGYFSLSVSGLKQYITDYAEVESSPTTLGGEPARKLVFTGTQGTYSFKWMQIVTLKGNKAYVVTYTAEQDKYPVFLDTAQQITDSFEFT